MDIEFIGFVGAQFSSEVHPPQGAAVDVDHIATAVRVHEQSGFDRVLTASSSSSPDSTILAAYAGLNTTRLGLMIAHRPGFIAPTIAARQFATLDQLTGGRVAIHIITGGDDIELAQDGSYIGKDERYARTDEYLDVLRKEWTQATPFDHQGKHYRFDKAFSSVKPLQEPHIPIYFGGSSPTAIEVAGRHADVYALWGETIAQVRQAVTEVRSAAAKHGRQLRFSLSLRPILGAGRFDFGARPCAWRQ
jgi:alkanesulfonate monooxygenase